MSNRTLQVAVRVLNTINTNNRIGIFSAEIHVFTLQLASLSILLIQSQVVGLNHFGSRISASCLCIYEELVCKEFSRSFEIATNGNYMLAEIVRSLSTAHGRSQ